jgi:hypothetical protein
MCILTSCHEDTQCRNRSLDDFALLCVQALQLLCHSNKHKQLEHMVWYVRLVAISYHTERIVKWWVGCGTKHGGVFAVDRQHLHKLSALINSAVHQQQHFFAAYSHRFLPAFPM